MHPKPGMCTASGAGSRYQGPDHGGQWQRQEGPAAAPHTPPPGCCSQRVSRPLRRRQLPGSGEATASSATRPTISRGTCRAACSAATLSARRVCGGWTHRPTSSAGSPARSAARARPRRAEGWPCWTSTWLPSWPSRPSGSRLVWSPGLPHPSKGAPPSLGSPPCSAPPWGPSPTSPSPGAAAGAAAPSAGTPRAAPRPELWLWQLSSSTCLYTSDRGSACRERLGD